MLRLISPESQPVRFWWFDMPDGKTRLKHSDPRMLYHLCVKAGLQMPFNEWYDQMIHRCCLEMSPNVCYGDDDGDQRIETLSFKKVRDFLYAIISVMVSFVKRESLYVSQEEADRRATICSSCQLNAQITCAGCHGFITLAHRFLRGREAAHQSKLGACVVCACFLAPTVWASPEVLERVDKKHVDSFPSHCWRRELND